MDRAGKSWWKVLLVPALFAGAASGCSGGDKPESKLSESRRDSVIAGSALPGAGAMGGALAASDSAKARAKRLEDIGQ